MLRATRPSRNDTEQNEGRRVFIFFSLYSDYSYPPTLSTVGEPSES